MAQVSLNLHDISYNANNDISRKPKIINFLRQFGGPDCVVACADACRALNGDYAHGGNRETLTSSSTDAASGQRDIHNLFNFADMQLGI